ncbi:hypothetical protein [Pseudomonas sp.]|uniref:hypothetical protein n=1 Tax=Pseudomonas sp. TaxID=306 RepID=UPI003C769A10
MTQTPAPDHESAAQATDASAQPSSVDTASKPAATGFASLFGAAKAAAGKQDGQPWHQKGNKSAHEKKIGPAPSGTRRSMGKR